MYTYTKNDRSDRTVNGYNNECIPEKLDKTVTNVVKLLERKGWTVSTAESCTGGLLSQLITSVPGASDVFELGVCSYSERIKNEILGVPLDDIAHYGVVSEEVALDMVGGLKRISGADICVSTTGIAGPSGGTPEKPVGTVWIGFDIRGRRFARLPELWKLPDKSRSSIRTAAAAFIFETLEKLLTEEIP